MVLLPPVPVRRNCPDPVLWRRRYRGVLFNVFLSICISPLFCLFEERARITLESLSHFQQNQLEGERAEKWVKMGKKWDKYRHSDKVCDE